MSKKYNLYILFLAAFALILANAAIGFAENPRDFKSFSFTNVLGADETILSETLDSETEPSLSKEDFLSKIKREFELSKTNYRQVQNIHSDTKERLNKVREERLSLKEQMKNLDDSIDLTSEQLLIVVRQLIATENEVVLMDEQKEVKAVASEYQKSLLKDYIRILYEQENALLSFGENGNIDTIKLLLTEGSVGHNLRDLQFYDLLTEGAVQMVGSLEEISDDLNLYELALVAKRKRLAELEVEIENERKQLELQRLAKDNLYKLTLGEEKVFTQLLAQTEEEQDQLLEDVKSLGEAVAFVELKIAEDGDQFDPTAHLNLLDKRTRALYDFGISFPSLSENGFIWPVLPNKKGISAYFRDPTYPGVFGVRHNAIDIPEYQGSSIRAAADGVVFSARDNGYGYSYVILSHADGYTTTYGHVSTILVEEGDIVRQGEIIALSGGMPGTKGAGFMTTGPHLHLEMMRNGMWVDPLDYLPLDAFTAEQATELPEKYFDSWVDAVLDAAGGLERFGESR